MKLPILLVEDDENDVFFMKRALKQAEVPNSLFVLDNAIILSSSDLERNIQEAYQAGANSFLVKPSTSEKLVNLVKLVKAYWLEVNRSPLG